MAAWGVVRRLLRRRSSFNLRAGAVDFEAGIEGFPNLQHPHDKIERSMIKIIMWTIGVIVLPSRRIMALSWRRPANLPEPANLLICARKPRFLAEEKALFEKARRSLAQG